MSVWLLGNISVVTIICGHWGHGPRPCPPLNTLLVLQSFGKLIFIYHFMKNRRLKHAHSPCTLCQLKPTYLVIETQKVQDHSKFGDRRRWALPGMHCDDGDCTSVQSYTQNHTCTCTFAELSRYNIPGPFIRGNHPMEPVWRVPQLRRTWGPRLFGPFRLLVPRLKFLWTTEVWKYCKATQTIAIKVK